MPIGIHANMRYRTRADRAGVAQRIVGALGNAEGQEVYTREDFAWSAAEPSDGVWSWTEFDELITDCVSNGLRVYAILDKPPVWAVGGTGEETAWSSGAATTGASWRMAPVSGQPLTRFAAYCGAFAARYGPDGTFWDAHPDLPRLPVKHFEVWNEPYMSGYWYAPFTGAQLSCTGTDYAGMFIACADAIHAANPAAEVHAAVDTGTSYAGTGVVPDQWLIPFLSTPGILDRIDGVSAHIYPGFWRTALLQTANTPRGPVGLEWKKSFTQTQRLFDIHAILANVGRSDIPVWITEIGYPTHPQGVPVPGLSEALQAHRVRDVFTLLRGNRRAAAGIIWFIYQAPPYLADQPSQVGYDPTNRERFYGFVHNDGTGGYGDGITATAKPAWNALIDEAALGVWTG